ncbi:MAG: VWA domain-containing protein, partial [Solirubrobacteraceae bacterium]
MRAEEAVAGRGIVAGVARFGRTLRAAGLEVGPGRVQDAVVALKAVEIESRQQVYWALRCTLLSRHGDIAAFDQAFAALFEGRSVPDSEHPAAVPEQPGATGQTASDERAVRHSEQMAEGEAEAEQEAGETQEGMRFSAIERLRELDFARYTDEELRRAARLVDRIAAAAPLRRSRRLRAAAEGKAFDKRRTLRHAMRTDGYPMVSLWRQPRLVPRKLVFAVDVSGSMEPYARAMLMFLQAAVRAGRRVEAFTFGTRLTRVTKELEGRNPDRALRSATRVVHD